MQNKPIQKSNELENKVSIKEKKTPTVAHVSQGTPTRVSVVLLGTRLAATL